MLPGEAENGVGMNRSARGGKIVKCFERSNGTDTALYKNYLYLFLPFIPTPTPLLWEALTMLQILREQYSFILFPPLSVAR